MSKVHNFSAGPGILPAEVLQQSAEAVLNFSNLNLSLLEISHRSKEYVTVVMEAEELVKELLQLPTGYRVIFLQGGASLQFSMVPFNLLEHKAGYLDTGTWANKALKEAQILGEVDVVASSKADHYTYIPKNYTIDASWDYFHITSNNTVYGTQLHKFPETTVPLVCDMSSDIFSRVFDASQFSLIYAGAQKNMGPAGVTMVIVKEDILGKVSRKIPTMLDYRVHIENDSMFNTPPVFALYVSLLTLRWLKANGGVPAMEQRNKAKAELFYAELDRNSLFKGTVVAEDRSKMNANFVLRDASLEAEFEALLEQANISGLKGHRSVGGYRASLYNALPIESVQVLVEVMQAFEQAKG